MDIEELELIQRCYSDYITKRTHYEEINRYYYGNTDTLASFTPMAGRSNLICNTNFVQKLVDEEAQYSFGNDITYTAKDDNAEVVKDINYVLSNNVEDHDINLGIELIKYGLAYEISYLDKNLKFKNKIVNPLNGYMYIVDDEPIYFLHTYKKQLDEKEYIDVYTNKFIYHFDSTWTEISAATTHYFGIVPVGFGVVGGKKYSIDRGYVEGDKTIYRTIKTLQDAFETNLSDMTSEISDTRNAIMKMFGIELESETDKDGKVIVDKDGKPVKRQPVIKDNCVLLFGDKKEQDAEWLIKNINDTFIKNTRDELKGLIYTLTSHLDTNEKLQSNLSGVALRSRLQNLEAKCKMNEKAMKNIIKIRLTCLFKYLYLTASKSYDVNLVKSEFTPNVPVDETSIAQMITQIPHEVVSNETKRSWLPRVENVIAEGEKIKKEEKESMDDVNLDKVGAVNEN
ncbi:phage portal protein [Clostridium sp. SHJSY1]|uniref:phage portal protein n=1 Tax=Clostridium sp. SHJSY1 TaxID=2942483 RepID=UPI002876274C|nr:phage portal protein [Clostridium sp. SHJSY1]MDS0525468.1 phage portal protein [Clostridium sp. SHJSY1]